MGGPKGAALLVFTPASWLACLLIHPTQCHRPGDTLGLGLPKNESRTGNWAITCLGKGTPIDKGDRVVSRSFVCHGHDDRSGGSCSGRLSSTPAS